MKYLRIILPVSVLIVFGAGYAVHIVKLSGRAFAQPVSITVDFASQGHVWKRRTILSLAGEPVARGELSETQIDAFRNYAVKRYGSSSLSSFCARALSRIVAEERHSAPAVRAADDLFLSLYLRARFDERTLAEAFLSRKTVLSHCTGLPVLSRTAFGSDLNGLSPDQFLSLVRFYCAPSKKNISSELYDKLSAFAFSLSVKEKSSFGENAADYCEKELKREGFYPPEKSIVIETSIDPERQKLAEDLIVRSLRNFEGQPTIRKNMLKTLPPIEGAALMIDVRTGGILAMTGSVRYGESSSLNRCESRRQISSTMKPFLYAQAFEEGVCTPDTVFEDKPVTMKNRDGSVWAPKNFYPYYIGEVKARDALSLSINTVSVQLIDKIGIGRMARKARDIFSLPGSDLSQRISSEPSLSLGSIDLSPLELAKGYLLLAARGEERFPGAVLSVSDSSGHVIWKRRTSSQGRRLLKKETCSMIIPVLQNVIRTGTASKFIGRGFDFDAAGKSGSSPSDSWFAGFNPETLIVVWAGYDIPSWSKQGKIPEFSVIPFWYALMSSEHPSRNKF